MLERATSNHFMPWVTYGYPWHPRMTNRVLEYIGAMLRVGPATRRVLGRSGRHRRSRLCGRWWQLMPKRIILTFAAFGIRC